MLVTQYSGAKSGSFALLRKPLGDAITAAKTFSDQSATAGLPSVAGAYLGIVGLPLVEVLVPMASPTVDIFDRASSTVVTGPVHGQGANAYQYGVALDADTVMLCPYKALNFGFYKRSTNSFIQGAAHGVTIGSSLGAFENIVRHPNGFVYLSPSSSTWIVRYNPADGSFANWLNLASVQNVGVINIFKSMVLLPGGDLFLPARNGLLGVRVNVTNATFVTFPMLSGCIGAVVAPSGKVVCIPSANATPVQIYDPIIGICDQLGPKIGTNGSTTTFWGGVLLPDGRVAAMPRGETFATLIDPVTKATTVSTASFGTGDHGRGGKMMRDGRVFKPSASTSTPHRIWTPFNAGAFAPAVVDSLYYNRA